MPYKWCVVLMFAQFLFDFGYSYAAEDEPYQPARTFMHVSTTEAENPERLIVNIKKNLLAILAKEKVLKEGYPKPCVRKEQADRSQICVEYSTVSLEDSSQWLLSEEGWDLGFKIFKFPSPMAFDKQIYILPDGFIAKLQYVVDGIRGNRDDHFLRVLVHGMPSKKFDKALDRAIIEAGAVVDE